MKLRLFSKNGNGVTPGHSNGNFFAAIGLVNEGKELFAKGRFKDAVESFNQAILQDKAFVNAYLGRAKANNRLGNHQEAIADLDMVKKLSEESHVQEGLNYEYGFAKYSLGDYNAAVEFCSIEINRISSIMGTAYFLDSRFLRAMSHLSIGNDMHLAAAEKELKEILKLNPAYPQANKILGGLLKEDARVAIGSISPHASNNLAVSAVNYLEEAIGCYNREIENGNSGSEILAGLASATSELAWAYFLAGQNQKSLEEFDKAIKLDPNNPNNYSIRATVNLRNGNDASAIDDVISAYHLALAKTANGKNFSTEHLDGKTIILATGERKDIAKMLANITVLIAGAVFFGAKPNVMKKVAENIEFVEDAGFGDALHTLPGLVKDEEGDWRINLLQN